MLTPSSGVLLVYREKNTINEWSFNKDMENTTPEGPFEFQAAVWVSDLTPQERVVALAYGSSYNWKNQDDSRCGIYRIAAMTGIGKSQVSKYRSSLTEKGWLETTRRFGTSSLTKPTVPAGFSYEDSKAKQDELVQSQNDAEKARRNKPSKKDEEIAALKAQLAALQAPVAPEETQTVQSDPEPATWSEMTDEEMHEALDLDPFEEIAPVAEKPAKKTERKDPMKEMLEARKSKQSFEDSFVETRIGGCDNPEEAKRLFNDEDFISKYPNKIQRAAQAAFEVEGSMSKA
ncbi:hypothetical protein ABZ714_14255 [Streptomyces sp. NPDC006798]|uniref:hypothetical protein n=1 Tax=unclassified Streptomyces TaxID=2593676 RepID=UPI0033CADB89